MTVRQISKPVYQKILEIPDTIKFSITLPLRMQDTDRSLHANPVSLLGIMQEAAILHSETVGRGLAWLTQRGLGWIVAQIRSVVFQIPVWRQEIRAATWFSDISSVLCRREFLLTDKHDQPLLAASSLWSCIRASTRKAVRPPPELVSAHPVYPYRTLNVPFRRPIRLHENHETWKSLFSARHRHIDFNGHVNNLTYLEWIMESLPDTFVASHSLREINIRFHREINPGDQIEACAAGIDESNSGAQRIAHEICLCHPKHLTLASAETMWQTDSHPISLTEPVNQEIA